MIIFNILRIFEVLFYYLIIVNLFGCLWLALSLHSHQTDTWLIRIPVPQLDNGVRDITNPDLAVSDSSLYIHTIYWSLVTISHIGVGDITAINIEERAFNCFTILCGTFIYAILFGNIAALVSDLSPILRSKLHTQYRFVMDLVYKKGIEKKFSKRLKEYYNYIWSTNKGVNEKQILQELPPALQ